MSLPDDKERVWKVGGAQIYTATKPKDVANYGKVEKACFTITEADNETVRWEYCDGANEQGYVTFPQPQTVFVGESIGGRASHSCNAGRWGWAAFIYVWPQEF